MSGQERRIRHSIQELAAKTELQPKLEKVLKAFAGIQALPPNDPNSFYFLGGFHGEPFRGPVAQYPGPKLDSNNPNVAQKLWWGGYCNHGNVLFPTWHRAYMHRVEKALQSIEGCGDVMLPFWDECFEMGEWNPLDPPTVSPDVVPQVIPSILTDEYVTIDGKKQKNPLWSYSLQRDTSYSTDDTKNSRFSKPKGYNTCRFPKRGVVCNEGEIAITNEWNRQFTVQSEVVDILNINVAQWLQGTIQIAEVDGTRIPAPRDRTSVYSRFQQCLDAPNYTVFSNTTSQGQWISDLPSDKLQERAAIVSLESPHNSMHLAVGGFFQKGTYNANPKAYQKASGDMGDNETASFDPIFFFHHAFIDYVFWTWQKKNGLTKRGDLDVLEDYPGTITDAGSPVGIAPGSMLDMDTPLYPFRKDKRTWITSNDVTDIHDLGYEYGPGSLDPYIADTTWYTNFEQLAINASAKIDDKIVDFKRTYGINRAEIQGSFVIRSVATYGGKEIEVGREAVLSRLNVRGCQNCQTHLEAQSLFPIYESVVKALGAPSADKIKYKVILDTYGSSYVILEADDDENKLSNSSQLFSDLPGDDALDNAKSIVSVASF